MFRERAANNLAQSLHVLLIFDHPSSSLPLARMTPSKTSTTSSTRLNPLAAPWVKRATDSPSLAAMLQYNEQLDSERDGLDVQRVDLVDTRSGDTTLFIAAQTPLLLLALLLLQLGGCWLSAKPTPAVLLAAVAHAPRQPQRRDGFLFILERADSRKGRRDWFSMSGRVRSLGGALTGGRQPGE
jgi:hypothetical protein